MSDDTRLDRLLQAVEDARTGTELELARRKLEIYQQSAGKGADSA